MKAVLGKRLDEPLEEDLFIDGETTNRGNKLKVGADEVHRDQLNGFNALPKWKKIRLQGSEFEYVQRKKRKVDDEVIEDEEEEKEEEEEEQAEDPYNGLDIRKILAPITLPAEVVTHPAISKIFHDESLRRLAQQAIEVIEYEQKNYIPLANMMDLFLGEDPKYSKPENMKLPDYDHALVQSEQPPHTNQAVMEIANGTGVTNNVKPEDYLSTLLNFENKRITRNIDSEFQEVDPFFALPQYENNRDNGIDPHIASDIRQYAQITLQRNQEYVRSLQNIRSGLIRAERLKDQVYKWCREMNGDYDNEIQTSNAGTDKKAK